MPLLSFSCLAVPRFRIWGRSNQRDLRASFLAASNQPGFLGIEGSQARLLLGADIFDEKASTFSSEQSELGHGLSPVLIVTEARKIPGASVSAGSESWPK